MSHCGRSVRSMVQTALAPCPSFAPTGLTFWDVPDAKQQVECEPMTLHRVEMRLCRFVESSSEEGNGPGGGSKPRPVPQASTNAELLQACPPSSSLCVFGLLDAATQEHAAAVAALESAAGRHWQFGFAWVDTPSQPSFASGVVARACSRPLCLHLSGLHHPPLLLNPTSDSA